MFASVWSSLLMVTVAALGILVSSSTVSLAARGKVNFLVRGEKAGRSLRLAVREHKELEATGRVHPGVRGLSRRDLEREETRDGQLRRLNVFGSHVEFERDQKEQ